MTSITNGKIKKPKNQSHLLLSLMALKADMSGGMEHNKINASPKTQANAWLSNNSFKPNTSSPPPNNAPKILANGILPNIRAKPNDFFV